MTCVRRTKPLVSATFDIILFAYFKWAIRSKWKFTALFYYSSVCVVCVCVGRVMHTLIKRRVEKKQREQREQREQKPCTCTRLMFLVRYQMDFLARLMVRTQINRQKYKGNQDKKNVHRIGFPFLLLLLPLSTTTPELLIVMWIQFQFQFRVFIFIINVSLIPMSAKCSCFWELRLCEWHFMGAYAFLHNFERCQSVVCNWFDDVFVSVSARQSTANTILRQSLLCSLSHFGHLIVFVFVFDIRIWTLDIISLAFRLAGLSTIQSTFQ